MNTHVKNQIQFVVIAVILAFSWNAVFADDLTPPPYRGAPLSVHAHWNFVPGSTILNLTNWSSVDDSDPTTTLYPNFTPNVQVIPANGIYQFQLPNWIDTMPIKYLRLQLTWGGTTQSPMNINTQGLDGVNPVGVAYTFSSAPQIVTSGVYQYFDIQYLPNPDFERINVMLPASNYLTQVVVDSVSTIPEPATMALLGLGAVALIQRKRK